MLPKLGDAKVDKILSQFSQMYRNENYISELLLPPLKVVEKTGKFAKYGTENLRTYTKQILRAPGARAVLATGSAVTHLGAEAFCAALRKHRSKSAICGGCQR